MVRKLKFKVFSKIKAILVVTLSKIKKKITSNMQWYRASRPIPKGEEGAEEHDRTKVRLNHSPSCAKYMSGLQSELHSCGLAIYS